MMHLSGLSLLGEVEPVINGLEKLGFAVRGLLGEGTEAHGNMFQVSNQSTLGESEEQIIGRLVETTAELTQHETNARARLLESRRPLLADHVARAFGILRHAQVLASKEAVDLLSGLRLGVELGMVEHLDGGDINRIMLLTQPGHLQKMMGRSLEPDERDEARACLVRDRLGEATLLAGGGGYGTLKG
jgi:protein arginine kinase